MSPEGLSHAMREYGKALEHQAEIAEAFFHGRLEEGMEGFCSLPEDVRLSIDQLLWEATGGEPLDPTAKESQVLIAAAIMESVQQRMGIA